MQVSSLPTKTHSLHTRFTLCFHKVGIKLRHSAYDSFKSTPLTHAVRGKASKGILYPSAHIDEENPLRYCERPPGYRGVCWNAEASAVMALVLLFAATSEHSGRTWCTLVDFVAYRWILTYTGGFHCISVLFNTAEKLAAILRRRSEVLYLRISL